MVQEAEGCKEAVKERDSSRSCCSVVELQVVELQATLDKVKIGNTKLDNLYSFVYVWLRNLLEMVNHRCPSNTAQMLPGDVLMSTREH